ncbi:MAG: type II secretion system F family protein [Opitutales bacterium]|nr:type II secretion system F family protein [Opitutales bacterium]MCH8540208.1 type II secretion system F family protein [Opitutales bacterium]
MPFVSRTSTKESTRPTQKKGLSFAQKQRLAKRKAIEKKAPKYKVKLGDLTVFTQQLASMLDAGLPLVNSLEALEEQVENPYFQVIVGNIRNDIAGGSSLSAAAKKYPRAFNNLFVSMVAAGEASGSLSEILLKVASYFEASLKLQKRVKSAMTYPIAVISLSIILVNVLLIFVVPVFGEMFDDFGAELPKPTQILVGTSDWLKANIVFLVVGFGFFFWAVKKFFATPRGRTVRDQMYHRLPIIGPLRQKISISRFCRTFSILTRSGVPILQNLEITGAASDNTFIENATKSIGKHVSQGGQISDVVANTPYFPSMVKHMARAGEKTGNVDGMLNKVSDFYDEEIDATVSGLTSLIEPMLIVFLGVFVGTIVVAMFLPIFQLSDVAGGP